MKVLNLRCVNDHRFEGWFASGEDFESQSGRGLVECPLCGDHAISRLPSAPHLNVSGLRQEAPNAEAGKPLQAAWLKALRRMVESTEDVGERFPEEARRIHYGEVPDRGIRGRASQEDAQALRDEGIEVMTLPALPSLKGPLQ
jgi:hypothetical protein